MLIVGAEMRAALDLRIAFDDAGLEAGNVFSISDAIEAIEAAPIRCAVLGDQLNGASAHEVAAPLTARSIPCIMVNAGKPSREALWTRAAAVLKPYRTEDVMAVALRQLASD